MELWGGGNDFEFSNDTLVEKRNSNPSGVITYTFDKAYKKCLVISSQYLASSQDIELEFTGCTVESKSEHFFGTNGNTYYANCKAYIIKDVVVGATIKTSTYQGFIIYEL